MAKIYPVIPSTVDALQHIKNSTTAQHIKTTHLHNFLPLWTLAKKIGVWPKQHKTAENSSTGKQCKYAQYATSDSASIKHSTSKHSKQIKQSTYCVTSPTKGVPN